MKELGIKLLTEFFKLKNEASLLHSQNPNERMKELVASLLKQNQHERIKA
ncbi:hypothetical protein R0131_05690 [Clostridium sp. AL.422]|nr:hypothetical protein [Clostridium sp. AL.422]